MNVSEKITTAEKENSSEPQDTGRGRWIGLGVLAAGLSMIVIDGTIVGVALPVIINSLKLDFSDAQWINAVYSVVFAALLLTAGRLSDRFGRRRLFVAGLVIFMGGSLLASLASEAGSLIAARVVQGIGGAFILPSTLSTVNATFRGKDRAVAFGIWGAVISGMAAVGPLLGGWLTTNFTWPWIFLVNLPIGIVIIIGAFLYVPETSAKITSPGVDVDGLLLSVIGFGGTVFALIEGGSLGWWQPLAGLNILGFNWPTTAPISIIPIVGTVGVLALVLFITWERHRAHNGRSAILDVRLFSAETFRWGNLTALCVAIGEFGLLFVLPLFLVNVLGLTTLEAGVVLVAMAAGAFFSGSQARHLAGRFGPTKVVVFGLGMEAVAVGVTGVLMNSGVSPWLLAGLLTIYGAGLGLASAQLTGTILVDIPPEQSGQGSATQSTVRQIGAALGTAIIGAILAAALGYYLPQHLDTVPGVPTTSAQQLVTATKDSAGGVISGLREAGVHSNLGANGPAVVNALAAGFADATRLTLLTAAAFLLVGAGFSLFLHFATDRNAGKKAEAETGAVRGRKELKHS
ncbi:MAG: DHA2 family efflux MFS transporter permease subunit [Chloroflexi bacterium]|nr:DHA2 family efflux MFS transporter permease subunit [Chloroflexota bacterium]OJV99342.1 MAG: MFS transporter [Chloroflexi bacterium 54-19]